MKSYADACSRNSLGLTVYLYLFINFLFFRRCQLWYTNIFLGSPPVPLYFLFCTFLSPTKSIAFALLLVPQCSLFLFLCYLIFFLDFSLMSPSDCWSLWSCWSPVWSREFLCRLWLFRHNTVVNLSFFSVVFVVDFFLRKLCFRLLRFLASSPVCLRVFNIYFARSAALLVCASLLLFISMAVYVRMCVWYFCGCFPFKGNVVGLLAW